MSLDKKWEGHEDHIQLNPLCPYQGPSRQLQIQERNPHDFTTALRIALLFLKKKKHGAFIHFFLRTSLDYQ